ncbi:alpha/beta fold hydrolase [Candidatus Micrarchaeota archaeon]|nr:alpha/beta fold hydrolase [Candidatus Micrarchaeota archaeon]
MQFSRKQFEFTLADGTKLSATRLNPITQEKQSTIVFIHGLTAAHDIPQYRHFLSALAEKGHEVIAFDQPGHGNAEKPFSAERSVNALSEVLAQLEKGSSPLGKRHEVFLAGHSLGGAIIASHLAAGRQKHSAEVRGVLVFAPPWRLKELTHVRAAEAAARASAMIPGSYVWNLVAGAGAAALHPRMSTLRERVDAVADVLKHRGKGITVDKMTHSSLEALVKSISEIPDTAEMLQKAARTSNLPATTVVLGTLDRIVGTADAKRRKAFAAELRAAGAEVLEKPFPHVFKMDEEGKRQIGALAEIADEKIRKMLSTSPRDY